MQLFAGFEADGFAGRNIDLFAGAWITADTGLARFDAEDPEAPKLNALAAAESRLQGFEDGFDSLLGLGAADVRCGNDRVHDVQLDHTCLPLLWQMLEGAPQVVKTRRVNYTVFPFGELFLALQTSLDD